MCCVRGVGVSVDMRLWMWCVRGVGVSVDMRLWCAV